MAFNDLNIKNHPILGNLYLDFFNHTKKEPYQTIVFVGENGAGKTSLLNLLFDYDKSDFVVKSTNFLQEHHGLFIRQNSAYSMSQNELVKVISGSDEMPIINETFTGGSNVFGLRRRCKAILKEEGKEIVNRFNDETINDFYLNNKLSNVSCGGKALEQISGKGGKFDITKLSSGQMEIILKLNNIVQIESGTEFVLFDEPETSLHPRWQKMIVSQLTELVSNNGECPQIFIATHSEKVLESLINQEDTLIIRLSKNKGKIKAENISDIELALPIITFAELDYLVFNINSFEYHNLLFSQAMETYRKGNQEKFDYSLMKRYGEVPGFRKEWLDKSKNKTYLSLPIYIRNYFHHPRDNESVSEEELNLSVKILRELILRKDK